MTQTRIYILGLSIMALTACASMPIPEVATGTALQAEAVQSQPLETNTRETKTPEKKTGITFVNNKTRATKDANGVPLICKKIKETGSRLKVTEECRTKAEWDFLKRQARDNIKNMYLKYGSDHG